MKPIFDSTLHDILNERLDKLEKYFKTEVIFYYGPIADSLEKPTYNFPLGDTIGKTYYMSINKKG